MHSGVARAKKKSSYEVDLALAWNVSSSSMQMSNQGSKPQNWHFGPICRTYFLVHTYKKIWALMDGIIWIPRRTKFLGSKNVKYEVNMF